MDIDHRVSTICRFGNIAIQVGRKLKQDPDAERFDNDEQANVMLARPMRSRWKLT